jgi:hypothetical protein
MLQSTLHLRHLLQKNLVFKMREIYMLQSALQLRHSLEKNLSRYYIFDICCKRIWYFTEREREMFASVGITTSSFAGNEFDSSRREVSVPQSALQPRHLSETILVVQ